MADVMAGIMAMARKAGASGGLLDGEHVTVTVPKDVFKDLTYPELAALSATFRRARIDCRKVMQANWWNAPVTDTYRRLVMDLQAHDPLFTDKDRHREIGFH